MLAQRMKPSRPSWASGFVELQHAPAHDVVRPGRLRHPVHVHLERIRDVVGQWNSPGFSHRRTEA